MIEVFLPNCLHLLNIPGIELKRDNPPSNLSNHFSSIFLVIPTWFFMQKPVDAVLQQLKNLPKLVTVTSTKGSRFYEIPGTNLRLPSVTTVLDIVEKPALRSWQETIIQEQIVQTLGKSGTHYHITRSHPITSHHITPLHTRSHPITSHTQLSLV